MSAFTYIAPDASVIIEHREDGSKVLQVRDGRVTLTKEHLRLLAYHAALYYRDIAHLEPLAPRNVVIDLPPFTMPNIL